jgi:MoxR-like ATPase
VLSLKVEYDSTIRKLTEQNEELMKQLQLVFEMKNRNEEELLKTLKLQEKLERDNALLEEKVKSVELKGQR